MKSIQRFATCVAMGVAVTAISVGDASAQFRFNGKSIQSFSKQASSSTRKSQSNRGSSYARNRTRAAQVSPKVATQRQAPRRTVGSQVKQAQNHWNRFTGGKSSASAKSKTQSKVYPGVYQPGSRVTSSKGKRPNRLPISVSPGSKFSGKFPLVKNPGKTSGKKPHVVIRPGKKPPAAKFPGLVIKPGVKLPGGKSPPFVKLPGAIKLPGKNPPVKIPPIVVNPGTKFPPIKFPPIVKTPGGKLPPVKLPPIVLNPKLPKFPNLPPIVINPGVPPIVVDPPGPIPCPPVHPPICPEPHCPPGVVIVFPPIGCPPICHCPEPPVVVCPPPAVIIEEPEIEIPVPVEEEIDEEIVEVEEGSPPDEAVEEPSEEAIVESETEPEPIDPETIDLLVEYVQLVEAGNLEKEEGPLYRVWFVNNGESAIEREFDIALLASNDDAPSETSPFATSRVAKIGAGERLTVEIRLPAEVLQMETDVEGNPQPFKNLFAAVDTRQELEERDEENNALGLARADIPAADLLASKQ